MLFHEMFSLIFPCPLPQTSEVPLWAFVARCAHWSYCLLCSVAEVHLTRIHTCLGTLVTCFLCIPKCLIWMSECKVIWVGLCNSVAFCRCWGTITLAVFWFEGTSHVFWADQIIAPWLLINNQLSFLGGVVGGAAVLGDFLPPLFLIPSACCPGIILARKALQRGFYSALFHRYSELRHYYIRFLRRLKGICFWDLLYKL